MKTNEWTHEEMSLKVQVNQMKPKKSGENKANTKNKTFANKANDLKEDVVIAENMAKKERLLGTSWKTHPESEQEEKVVGVKVKGKLDISKVKYYNCYQLGHFAKDCPFPYRRIKKEEDQYQPSAFAMICMDEEKDMLKQQKQHKVKRKKMSKIMFKMMPKSP